MNGVYQPQTTTKVGIILYMIAFIALAAIAGVTVAKLSKAPRDDKRLILAVIIALAGRNSSYHHLLGDWMEDRYSYACQSRPYHQQAVEG